MVLHLLQIQATLNYIITFLLSPIQKRLSFAVSLMALAVRVHVIDLH